MSDDNTEVPYVPSLDPNFSVDTSLLDGFGLPEDGESLATSVDLVDAMADAMLDRTIAKHPELGQSSPGLALVVTVTDPSWVEPLSQAWRRRVPVFPPLDGERSWPNHVLSDRWVLFVRSGRDKSEGGRTRGNEHVAHALAQGASVIGFATHPTFHLPAALVRTADHQFLIPPPDAELLAKILGIEAADLEGIVFASLTPNDLRAAIRPGGDRSAALPRLRRLASPKPTAPITLNDLHGMPEAQAWGLALAADIVSYRTGGLSWSAIDRGVLIFGPPGTGKTAYARALAGTAGLPLIAASLAIWQSAGHLGDMLRAMRKTFDEARSTAPCILFIDEIDSAGNRQQLDERNREYGTQVINALLELLDGIQGREGVIVIAACNYPQRLDPALTRSGRLDRAIAIPLPNEAALAHILRFHLGEDLAEENLDHMAALAVDGTGADCERWVRGARRRARQARRPMILADLEIEIAGLRPSRSPQQLYRYAIHEAGHAVAAALTNPRSLVRVTLRQSRTAAGKMVLDPKVISLDTAEDYSAALVRLLAGRAAEAVILGYVSAGAGGSSTSDLALATTLAVHVVAHLGLDGQLLWQGEPEVHRLGDWLRDRPQVADRAGHILDRAYGRTIDLVRKHRRAVRAVAQLLIDRETVERKDILETIERLTVRSRGAKPGHSDNLQSV